MISKTIVSRETNICLITLKKRIYELRPPSKQPLDGSSENFCQVCLTPTLISSSYVEQGSHVDLFTNYIYCT